MQYRKLSEDIYTLSRW